MQRDAEPAAVAALPRALGEPVLAGTFRTVAEDFFVEELPAFEASGSGEHLLLTIEKQGLTTHQALARIARWAGVAESAIGYAGLKDRHARTRQRLSVWLPKQTAPDTALLHSDALQVLDAHWHRRKLPRGALAGNRFVLRLREVRGEKTAIAERLAAIARHGVPNYFGEQRFGRGGRNVQKALAMFAGQRVRRDTRSLLLSAARAEIFNAILAGRVQRGTWQSACAGEVFMLAGSHSLFGPLPLDETLHARLAQQDIHPTGALWGQGSLRSEAEVAQWEADVAASHAALCAGLEAAGLKQERRSLRLPVAGLQHRWLAEDVLELAFSLPAGSYATVVLRELGTLRDASAGNACAGEQDA